MASLAKYALDASSQKALLVVSDEEHAQLQWCWVFYQKCIYGFICVYLRLSVVNCLPPYGLSSTSTLERCSMPGIRTPLSLICSLTQVGVVTW